MSQLLGDWLDCRSALRIVRVGLILNLIALCGLQDWIVLLLILLFSSVSL